MTFASFLGKARRRAPVVLVLVVVIAVIGGGSTALLAAGPATPTGGASCSILDPGGNPVTQIHAASFGDMAYWLQYRSSGTIATKVRFTVKATFSSPALQQVQEFDTDFSNVVTTPFGIPDWGGNKTSGPYALQVKDNLGRGAVCPFDVVP